MKPSGRSEQQGNVLPLKAQAPRFHGAITTLGIHAHDRVWVGGHDARVRSVINALVAGANRPDGGPIDVALLTPLTIDELRYFAGKIRSRLVENGLIGVAWSIRPEDCDGPQSLANGSVVAAMATLRFVECGERRLDDAIISLRFRSMRNA